MFPEHSRRGVWVCSHGANIVPVGACEDDDADEGFCPGPTAATYTVTSDRRG